MTLVRLRPGPVLPVGHPVPTLPLTPSLLPPAGEVAVTFRSVEGRPVEGRPVDERDIHGATRLNLPLRGDGVTLLFLQSDSRLALPLLWDVFHQCPVGTRLRVVEAADVVPVYTRAYYTDCLILEGREDLPGGVVAWEFRKTTPGLVETDADLDGWSVGLLPSAVPAADRRAELAACLVHLQGLGLPDLEILVAGPLPIGMATEGIRSVVPATTPPTGAAWRNALAVAATRPNLCLMETRHRLPAGLPARLAAWGPAFPFTGLQTLWFFDGDGVRAQRGADMQILDWRLPGLNLERGGGRAPFPVPAVRRFGQFIPLKAHPADHREHQYLTGIILCKRRLWRRFPADEAVPEADTVAWSEGADAAHGLAAAAAGIPIRLLPRGFARVLTVTPAEVGVQHFPAGPDRASCRRGVPLAALPFLPPTGRAALLPVSARAHRRGLHAFVQERVETIYRDEVHHAVASMPPTVRGHLFTALLILARCPLRRNAAWLGRFLDDYFAQVLRLPLPPFRRVRLVTLGVSGAPGFLEAVGATHALGELVALAPYADLFAADAAVASPGPARGSRGRWLAAGARLWGRNPLLFHEGTWAERFADLAALSALETAAVEMGTTPAAATVTAMGETAMGRIFFLDDRLVAREPACLAVLAAHLSRQSLPDFTWLTDGFVAALPPPDEPAAVEWLSGAAKDSPSPAARLAVVRSNGDRLPDGLEALLHRPDITADMVIVAPPSAMPALTEALRPLLYVTHPYRTVGELRAFAEQIVSDGLFFNEHSVFRLPLVSRPTPLGRRLRRWMARFVLQPSGRW